LSEPRITIMKIGGSVITDKNTELAPQTQTIDRLAVETQRADARSLIIVHGGGSFGHPAAQRNAIKEGLKKPDQMFGFAETHHFMTMLNGLVMDSFIMHSVPAVSITPLSCVVTESGRIRSFEDTPLKMLLNLGFLPVLYGDAVLDAKLGFTVLSGDQLVSALATKLNAKRIIVGVDVDGLCDSDPKIEKTAKRFPHLTLSELKQLQKKVGKSTAVDVTGGMFGKIAELIPALEKGVSVTILNATKPGLVYMALKGENVEGTLIEKE
jgi:isopentenyl phosphate kinase